MFKENEERFDKLISEHGTDIACAIIDRLQRFSETGERDELLENILFPKIFTDEIKGIVPMDGPVGNVFYLNFSPPKVVGENKELGMVDDYDLN